MEPLISVIIPVYNAADFLVQNVESLINQTYNKFEAIYVDDGSEDMSLTILRDFEKRDPRIRVFPKQHEGVGSARNFGVTKTKGDYILFMDADDFYATDAFMELVNAVKVWGAEVEIVLFNYNKYDNLTKTISKGKDMSLVPQNGMFACRDLAGDLLQIHGPNLWKQMYRADIVKESSFYCLNSMAEDMVYAVLLMVKSTKMIALDKCIYFYRSNNPKSACGGFVREKRSGAFALSYLKQGLEQLKEYEFYKKTFWKWAIPWFYRVCLKAADLNTFSYHFHIAAAFFEQCFCTKEYVQSYCGEDLYQMFCELTELSEMEFLFRHREHRRVIPSYSFDVANKVMLEGKRIVLYGAGCVGKYYYALLTSQISCDVMAWVDRNYEKFADSSLNIQSIDSIQDLQYDFILIAVFEKHIAEEIQNSLKKNWEIAENKILWFQPVHLN